MSAITKACSVRTTNLNTGKECDTSMNATAMLIVVPRSLKFDDDDLADPVPWMQGLIQERKAFPLFGQQAPIRTITNNQDGDVEITLDDGLVMFLRYGLYNRIFETTSGGLCYAKALQSFNKSGMSIIEIDQTGQMLVRKNADGTYSGLIMDNMNAPSPVLADFKNTPYKNRFKVAFSPVEMVTNGLIFEGASELLSLMGLIDAEIVATAAGSTTVLSIGVNTECADADLVDLFGADLAHLDNFIVTNKATGAVITPTAANLVSGHIELVGTYVSGQTYNVVGSTPEDWAANNVEGYDASAVGNSVDILIP